MQIEFTEQAIKDEKLFKKSRLDPSNVDDASLDAGINQAGQRRRPICRLRPLRLASQSQIG
jgi:hypothetical protein